MASKKDIFTVLVPITRKLKDFKFIYGVSVGHYQNSRSNGYIDLEFDAKNDKEVDHKMHILQSIIPLPYGKYEEKLGKTKYISCRFFYEGDFLNLKRPN